MLFTKCDRGVELGTTENKSSWWQGGGFEPGTSRFQIQRPKPLGHAASEKLSWKVEFYLPVINYEVLPIPWEPNNYLYNCNYCITQYLIGYPVVLHEAMKTLLPWLRSIHIFLRKLIGCSQSDVTLHVILVLCFISLC